MNKKENRKISSDWLALLEQYPRDFALCKRELKERIRIIIDAEKNAFEAFEAFEEVINKLFDCMIKYNEKMNNELDLIGSFEQKIYDLLSVRLAFGKDVKLTELFNLFVGYTTKIERNLW